MTDMNLVMMSQKPPGLLDILTLHPIHSAFHAIARSLICCIAHAVIMMCSNFLDTLIHVLHHRKCQMGYMILFVLAVVVVWLTAPITVHFATGTFQFCESILIIVMLPVMKTSIYYD